MIAALVTGKIRTAATERAVATTMAATTDHHLDQVMAMCVATVMAMMFVTVLVTIFKAVLMTMLMVTVVAVMLMVMAMRVESVSLGTGTAAVVLGMREGITHE